MDLPIDVSRAPYRAKYLDEETKLFSIWFEFGSRGEGLVDIADGFDDVLINVPKDKAARILEARQVFINALLKELS